MYNIVAVTGPMRSGTSLVAAALHAMGVRMAETLIAPMPGGHVQWEDRAFGLRVADAVLHQRSLSRIIFRNWFLERDHSARMLARTFDVDGWGVKAPPLVLLRHQFEELAAEHDFHVQWVTCDRPVADCRAAQRAWARRWITKGGAEISLAFRLEEGLDARVRAALPLSSAACHVDFDEWRDDPDGLARHLCDSLSLNPSRVAAGAAAITPRRQ